MTLLCSASGVLAGYEPDLILGCVVEGGEADVSGVRRWERVSGVSLQIEVL